MCKVKIHLIKCIAFHFDGGHLDNTLKRVTKYFEQVFKDRL